MTRPIDDGKHHLQTWLYAMSSLLPETKPNVCHDISEQPTSGTFLLLVRPTHEKPGRPSTTSAVVTSPQFHQPSVSHSSVTNSAVLCQIRTRPLRLSAPLGPTKKECLEEFAPASVQEIAKLLSNIDVRKAAGSDQVPAAILKHCSPVLAPSLTILINA